MSATMQRPIATLRGQGIGEVRYWGGRVFTAAATALQNHTRRADIFVDLHWQISRSTAQTTCFQWRTESCKIAWQPKDACATSVQRVSSADMLILQAIF